jgi:hypothetical protein
MTYSQWYQHTSYCDTYIALALAIEASKEEAAAIVG